MRHEPSPAEEAAARLLTGPDFVRRRLNADLVAIPSILLLSPHVEPDMSPLTSTPAVDVE
ncbi:MAG TPA: hypothetical protein VK054_13530 [Beutenbergiaceae bacterium]|nr:hypothetical protein [Beutenbergiaceae bacterium]